VADAAEDRDCHERRFRTLYRDHYCLIQAYAVRRVESEADVADVVAEVFTTAWRRLDEVPSPPGDRLWLYGVARRVIAGKRRSTRRLSNLVARLEASYDQRTGQPPQTSDGLHERVLAALRCLGPAEREAVHLVLWEQLSHAEAACVLGCSANAVAVRMHRAKARLRAALTAGGTAGSLESSGRAGRHGGPAHAPASRPNGS
jgi:RNA polymerase sigma-70 factor (ECF subfamily)